MMICTAGMIGIGKSSLSKCIGEHFGTEVFYEKVDDNIILPLFYTMTEEELQKNRIPFLLQLDFLDSRFKAIKRALEDDNNVLDRSIYEDWYFAKVNMELGRISKLEFTIYENLLSNMLEELKGMKKKAPDLLVYLRGSFETVIERIGKRGRDFEQDDNLIEYYHKLWQGYDEWVMKHYSASEVLIVDMDKFDVVNSVEDKQIVLEMIENKLLEVRGK